MQCVATVVVHRQRQAVEQLPTILCEDRAVYHQRGVACVAQRQRRRGRLRDGRVAQVKAVATVQIGTIDAYRASIDSREHIGSRAVAQGGLEQTQGMAPVAVQMQREARHHTVGAVDRRAAEVGQQQHQCVAQQARRGGIACSAGGVGSEAALHIGQCRRQLDEGLQPIDAIHVVHAQLDGSGAVGVAITVQRTQLIHRIGIGVDA